jgi:SAM-dependent methyltransferase
MSVSGFDVSPIAIGHARELARRTAVDGRCRFDVLDLDDGLPDGPAAHVIVCHKFRDARLDQAVLDRLAPGGLLAISALSEVGSEPGPFHARPGELLHALGVLEVVSAGEGDGLAWLLGRHGDQST